MDGYLVWLVAGFALVIAELVSGTFFLLVLGIAAFAGGAASWLGAGFWIEAIVAAAVAVLGLLWVRQYRKGAGQKRMAPLDLGQPAVFDSWVNRGAGQARVKYRDALWDAQIAGEAAPEPGEMLYVTSVDGNTLKVSKTRPA